MPPKKILQPLPGQKRLSFEGWPFHTGSNVCDEPTESVPTVPGIDSVPTSSSSLSNLAIVSDNEGNEKKKRKFLPNWLKTYGWLKYDEEKNFMYCDVCSKFIRKNSLNRSEE